MKKNLKLLFFGAFVMTALVTMNVLAFEVKGGQTYTLSEGETIEGDLFVSGNIVNIDGVVTGDLFFGCATMIVNGEVQGDIIGACQTFTLNGTARDDVRVWTNSTTINGPVEKSLSAFGADVNVTKSGSIGRDVFLGCGYAKVKGDVLGEIKGGSHTLEVYGIVGKKIKFEAALITLHPEARIKGDVIYRGDKLYVRDGAEITGNIEKLPQKKYRSKWQRPWFYFSRLLCLIGAFIVGLLLIKLFPGLTTQAVREINTPGRSLGVGVLVLICLPVAALILMVTILGIPLAFMLVAFYLIFMYVGKTYLALFFGQKVLRLKENHSILALLLGLAVFTVLFSIPYLGCWLRLIAALWGLGAMSVVSFQAIRKKA